MLRTLLALLLLTPCVSAQAPNVSLSVDTGRTQAGAFRLDGRDAWQQLQITARDQTGQERDVTRRAQFSVAPPDIAAVDAAGLVTPRKEGRATITATHAGTSATVDVIVDHLVNDVPVHFAKQVVPLLTKHGCNAGGCHGRASGQNGFKLSLLGFEPEEDFETITRENRGRRIFPASPRSSLLLMKAAGQMPHGGGKKIDPDSPAYRVIARWIEQGTPYGKPTDPAVTRIEVLPNERLLDRASEQQLTVLAHLSDGSTVDVTRMAQFETNEKAIAEVDANGLIATRSIPGVFAIMARYQTHIATFRGVVPLGAPVAELPPAKNFIDELVFRQLKTMGVPPSPLADDATYIRRVTLDLAGRLPTVNEVDAFHADTSPTRFETLVDRLLASPDFGDYFASKWSAVLRNRRATPKDDPKPSAAFHAWIRDSLNANVPMDQFLRGVLTAKGEAIKVPTAIWYREAKDISTQVEDVAQLFLGQRIACAKCHHHPFEKWTTDDYWGLAAFFSRVEVKAAKSEKKDNKTKMVTDPGHSWLVNLKPGKAEAVNPKTKKAVKAAGLDAPAAEMTSDDDPRGKLVDWMVEPKNPFFAKTMANRYWKHFLGRGLVEPEDDMRVTNPPTNPALLDALARSFTESGYDAKKLARTICLSNVYRLSAIPNAQNADDTQSYSRFLPRRIPAEALFDAIDAVTLTQSKFKGVPEGTRAVQLPDNQFESYFLSVFGRPDFASVCECERSGASTLAQSLHMYNSVEIGKKVAGERAKRLTADKRPVDEKLRELYIVALSRPPSDEELSAIRQYLDARRDNPMSAYEDVLWTLINTKEFAYNH